MLNLRMAVLKEEIEKGNIEGQLLKIEEELDELKETLSEENMGKFLEESNDVIQSIVTLMYIKLNMHKWEIYQDEQIKYITAILKNVGNYDHIEKMKKRYGEDI